MTPIADYLPTACRKIVRWDCGQSIQLWARAAAGLAGQQIVPVWAWLTEITVFRRGTSQAGRLRLE